MVELNIIEEDEPVKMKLGLALSILNSRYKNECRNKRRNRNYR